MRTIRAGVDIGTYQVKVMIAENNGDGQAPKILGMACAESRGLRHGYIINPQDVTKSVLAALTQAQKTANVKVRKAYLALGGIGLSSITTSASVAISKADLEITELDVKNSLNAAENEIPKSFILNRRIIHSIPLQYKVDGKVVLGRPLGMRGTKLEIKAFFVAYLEQHLNDLVGAVEDAGLEVEDVLASPLAAALITLNKVQKTVGCVLANVGAETVSIAVFDNNIPISLEVFPIGSSDITNDIALGLRVPIEEAEEIKRGSLSAPIFPKKKLEDIVLARLTDIFELIDAHLKKIGKNELLPAGIILTGGGSGMANLEEIAKAALKLPSRIATLPHFNNAKIQVKDASWAVAYGLCVFAFGNSANSLGTRLTHSASEGIIQWIKQFLP